MDTDYPPKPGILPQYRHVRSFEEAMPIIRKLLGLPAHGRIPTNTAIGKAVQRIVDNHSKRALCESKGHQHETVE